MIEARGFVVFDSYRNDSGGRDDESERKSCGWLVFQQLSDRSCDPIRLAKAIEVVDGLQCSVTL